MSFDGTLAAVFCYDKDLEICANHADLLRRYNPDIPIYCLFAGANSDRAAFERGLAPWVDDFWAWPKEKDRQWKWLNNDLICADWFSERGVDLTWDTIVMVQWDALFLAPMTTVFSELRKDEIYLIGTRPVSEVEDWWHWVKRREPRREYKRFLKHVRKHYGYSGTPLACLAFANCLPRTFLERYAAVPEPELGFTEYRLPIYAQVFDVPFSEGGPNLHAWWAGDPSTRDAPEHDKILNAGMSEVSLETVLAELEKEDGARFFHPFRLEFPIERAPARPSVLA